MGSSPIYLDLASYYPRPALTFPETACCQAIPARTQHTALFPTGAQSSWGPSLLQAFAGQWLLWPLEELFFHCHQTPASDSSDGPED